MEELIESSLKEYKKFFDEATVGLCRFDIKTTKFIMVNDYCAKLLGYDSPEALIRNEENLTKLIGKEEKQRLVSRLKREGMVDDYELKMNVNSNIVWVSAFVHINCGGSCIQGTLINITNQKNYQFEIDIFKNKQIAKLANIKEKLDTMIDGYEN